jgi:hypothetical protein
MSDFSTETSPIRQGVPPLGPAHRHPSGLQGAIYRLEHGGGAKFVRAALALLVLAALAAFYDSHYYKNFHSEEAMDSAQLAGNLAGGRGFTTLYVRPASLGLLAGRGAGTAPGQPQPDIANAPVYPLLLAGLFKSLPFRTDIPSARRRSFSTYQPELIICLLNQLLFLAAAASLFFLARKLFDEPAAWISAIAFAGSEVYWKFSASGLPTLLLVLIFLGLAWLLVVLDAEVHTESPRLWRVVRLGFGLGAIAALGALTRYAFGWIMVPLAVFLLVFGGKLRWPAVIAAVAAFLLLMAPWLWRNYSVSGGLFGLSAYAPAELTELFPGDSLVRCSDLGAALQKHPVGLWDYSRKMTGNIHEILEVKFPTLGANWLFTLFLAGFLVPFNNQGLARLRYFLLILLVVFIPVEALGKTHLSAGSPVINSENLLVIFAPLTFIYGAGFFCILAEQGLHLTPFLRPALAGFALLTALPFLSGLLAPTSSPVAYPPYYPPALRAISTWIGPEESVMTDIPWAFAWYGRRRAVGLPLDAKEEFERVQAATKDVRMVFLSASVLDGGFRGLIGPAGGWGRLAVSICVGGRPPKDFPFQAVQPELLPDEVLLGDRLRWEAPDAPK